MAFDSIIRNGVKLAERLTRSLQVEVEVRRWVGGGGYEGESYAAPIFPRAIVDMRLTDHHTSSGQVIVTKAHVMILEELPPEGAEQRIEPIDRRDHVTLPNGQSGPIVDVGGAGIDPTTGLPFTTEFWIGAGSVNQSGR
jgi:hypothetical protein